MPPLMTLMGWLAGGCMLLAGASHADPLQRPARASSLASQRLLQALAPAGDKQLVAAGQRGHVLVSTDGGTQWVQARVPVSSDLTALQFIDALRGYAVGHDGVVLRSDDGGLRWEVVLDGRRANALALEQLEKTVPGAQHEHLRSELQRNAEVGPDKPFMDLYFLGADEGFVVGAYNLIFHTRDGGRTWESWYDRSDNGDGLFGLNAIRPHRGSLFVVGESGLLMRLDRQRQRFERIDTGYGGSFFGLLDAGEALIAHGMRGNAVISRDGGLHWQALETGLQASVTASGRGPDGTLWLADQIGRLSVSRDGGRIFTPLRVAVGMPVAALHIGTDRLTLAGPRGVRSIPLPKD